MTTRRAFIRLGLGLALVALFSFGGLQTAEAGKKAKASKVVKKFGGKIITSDKRFPLSAKSEAAYIAKVKKLSKAKFWESKEDKTWTIQFVAVFKKALPDLEYTLLITDATGGVLASTSQFADSSSQTTVTSSITLERRFVGVNKKCIIQIVSGGRTMATGAFQILGEVEKHDGKVDFGGDANSEDEE